MYTARIKAHKKTLEIIENVKDVIEGINGTACYQLTNGNVLIRPMDGVLEIELVKVKEDAVPKTEAKKSK